MRIPTELTLCDAFTDTALIMFEAPEEAAA